MIVSSNMPVLIDFASTECLSTFPTEMCTKCVPVTGHIHPYFQSSFYIQGTVYHAKPPTHGIVDLTRTSHTFVKPSQWVFSFACDGHCKMRASGCDDKLSGNLELCNTSIPEHTGRNTNGKPSRQGAETPVASDEG